MCPSKALFVGDSWEEGLGERRQRQRLQRDQEQERQRRFLREHQQQAVAQAPAAARLQAPSLPLLPPPPPPPALQLQVAPPPAEKQSQQSLQQQQSPPPLPPASPQHPTPQPQQAEAAPPVQQQQQLQRPSQEPLHVWLKPPEFPAGSGRYALYLKAGSLQKSYFTVSSEDGVAEYLGALPPPMHPKPECLLPCPARRGGLSGVAACHVHRGPDAAGGGQRARVDGPHNVRRRRVRRLPAGWLLPEPAAACVALRRLPSAPGWRCMAPPRCRPGCLFFTHP